MNRVYTLAEIRSGAGFAEDARFVQVDTRDKENAAKLAEIGKRAFESIAEMVAALECDYERLEELREYRQHMSGSDEPQSAEDADELAALEKAAGECDSRDDAERRIQEHPLSVEVRHGWHAPGDDDTGAEEFSILLATGGPAVRIVGELNQHCEPVSAKLQVQDWFLPWTDYTEEVDEEVLLDYCRCFYFGEG